jgi:hypothetical protein
MMHPLLQTVLVTVLVPAAVAGAFVLVAAWTAPGRWRSALWGGGLGVAWCTGVWLAVRAPRWPAVQASDWHFFAVAVAAVVVMVTPWWRGRAVWRWWGGVLFFGVVFALILHRFLAALWPAPGAWLWPAGAAALAVVSAAAVGLAGRQVQAAATAAGLMSFGILSSAALVLGGSASLAHASGILAAACGAAWAVSLLLRRQVDMLPAGFVAATVFGGLLVQGVVYAQLRPVSALVLALTWPAAAVVAKLARHASGGWRTALFLGAVVAPAAIAVWLANG